jgi:hypothetical protein
VSLVIRKATFQAVLEMLICLTLFSAPFSFPGLSSPPLGPHNNNYNREDNCIEQANESSAMPIFIFMIAQVKFGGILN